MEQKYYTDIVAGLAERTIKRLWIVILVLVVLLVGSNAAWLVYEAQFEDEITTTQEVEQFADGDGDNNFIGGDYYGEAKSENNDN